MHIRRQQREKSEYRKKQSGHESKMSRGPIATAQAYMQSPQGRYNSKQFMNYLTNLTLHMKTIHSPLGEREFIF